MAGIYIHIPFCKQACHYCDFHFSTNQRFRTDVIKALTQEIILQENYLGKDPIHTIYFGGGTPSICSLEELELLLATLHDHFTINNSAEITLESNPDDLTKERLTALKSMGFNRISLGIQSFNDSTLKFLNRAHDGTQGIASVENARSVGFNNISIDLIYGIPNQSAEDWMDELQQANSLSPEHLSCYSLTIEENTVFGKWEKKGKLTPASEDLTAKAFLELMDFLEDRGYEHYEISNFCKPGFQSRHNGSYWLQEKYLGIGPSAHSYNGQTRQFNIAHNITYMHSIDQGVIPCQTEHLTRANKINEFLMTGLRTSKGCSLNALQEKMNYNLLVEQVTYIEYLRQQGLATLEDNTLRLTRQGKLLADKISSDLFVSEE